jgi:hypothetical protein
MKKIIILLTVLFSINSFAIVPPGFYTGLAYYIAKGRKQLIVTKRIITNSQRMAIEYSKTRNKVRRDKILSRAIEAIQTNRRYVPKIFKSYVSEKLTQIRMLRHYLDRGYVKSHGSLQKKLFTDISDIYKYAKYL